MMETETVCIFNDEIMPGRDILLYYFMIWDFWKHLCLVHLETQIEWNAQWAI